MVTKNKNTTVQTFKSAVTHAGFAVMALATVLSITELADKQGHKAVAVLQPQLSYAVADDNQNRLHAQHSEELRRGAKEEIRHTSASYGVQMRDNYVSGGL